MDRQDKVRTNQSVADDIQRGEVVFFDKKKGFGFIKPNAGGKDVFVNYTEIACTNGVSRKRAHKSLENKQQVEYELSQGKKGMHATNVTPIQ